MAGRSKGTGTMDKVTRGQSSAGVSSGGRIKVARGKGSPSCLETGCKGAAKKGMGKGSIPSFAK